jgi:hypothetical protein
MMLRRIAPAAGPAIMPEAPEKRPRPPVSGLFIFVLLFAPALPGIRFFPYMLGTLFGLPLPIALYCLFFEQFARFTGLHA